MIQRKIMFRFNNNRIIVRIDGLINKISHVLYQCMLCLRRSDQRRFYQLSISASGSELYSKLFYL